jgi:hypothetical protein
VLFGLRAEEAVRFGLPDRDFVPQSMEEKLVALVDYLIEFDRPTTLERRFRSLRRRNAGHTFFLERLGRAFAAARAFMEQIEGLIGTSLEDMPAAGTPRKRPPTRGSTQASRDRPSMNSGKVVL